jgi:hypothetical protein
LRTVIDDDDDDASLTQIINRITACVILHNLMIGATYPEGWEAGIEEDTIEEDMDYEYEEQFIPSDIEADCSSRREEMMNYILQWLG